MGKLIPPRTREPGGEDGQVQAPFIPPQQGTLLAVVVRCAPELFARTEVNLAPERLEVLADRDRALTMLDTATTRLLDLVKDSHMEQGDETVDRKSTRLNSSHDQISYAVFC